MCVCVYACICTCVYDHLKSDTLIYLLAARLNPKICNFSFRVSFVASGFFSCHFLSTKYACDLIPVYCFLISLRSSFGTSKLPHRAARFLLM